MKFRYGWWRVGALVAALALLLGAGTPLQAAGEAVPPPACPEVGPSPSLACDKEILLALQDDLLAGSHTGYNLGFMRWQDDVPVRDFRGVTVGGEPPRVTGLELSP